MASRDGREAPEDPDGREAFPGVYFLLAMHKTLAEDFAEPGGISVFCKGGLYHWTLRAPGINRRFMGTSPSLTTLLDDMEAQYRSGAAAEAILKKEREERFQAKMKKS